MGAECTRIIQCLSDVFSHWILLLGGVVMIALGVLERIFRKEVHWKLYTGIVGILLFSAFYMSWRDMRITLDAKPQPTQQIAVIQKDPETQKQLEEAEVKLSKAEERLRELDPIRQPIASGSFMVNMVVKSDKQVNTRFLVPGGEIGFGRGDKPLLMIGVGDASANTIQNQQVAFRVLSNSQISGPLVGKPMTELGTAEYIQIELKVLPNNIEVLSGTIEVTLNSTQRFQCDIPPQKAIGQKVFVQDLSPIKSKLLIMQP